MDKQINIFKALGDKNRLAILDMLSCGELCACDILEGLDLTQPTLSHHMKILQQSGLVTGVKNGIWMNYSINRETIDEITSFINYHTNYKEDCICNIKKREV